MIILAIDNNTTKLEQLSSALRSVFPGAEILSFLNPMLAVKFAYNNTVQRVYTEVNMARMSGFDVERLIHKANPEAKILFVTEREPQAAEGVEQWLKKPVTAEQIALVG